MSRRWRDASGTAPRPQHLEGTSAMQFDSELELVSKSVTVCGCLSSQQKIALNAGIVVVFAFGGLQVSKAQDNWVWERNLQLPETRNVRRRRQWRACSGCRSKSDWLAGWSASRSQVQQRLMTVEGAGRGRRGSSCPSTASHVATPTTPSSELRSANSSCRWLRLRHVCCCFLPRCISQPKRCCRQMHQKKNKNKK